jgi:DNA repair protein RecN (Recombination protein N)
MLTSLIVRNFAIVSFLELDFTQGMTVFTGETGAGKSIIIDALLLALGGRFDASMIKSNARACEISAVFVCKEASRPMVCLNDNEISHDAGEIILRRVLYAEGRSKSFINGVPVTLQQLKDLGLLLVNIHGQHHDQDLFRQQTQRELLDAYAESSSLLTQTSSCYRECQKILGLIAGNDEESLRQQILDYTHELNELSALNLFEGEIDVLYQEHKLMHNAKAYLEDASYVLEILHESDAHNIEKSINGVLQKLTHLPQDNVHINNATELLANALIHCEEAANVITSFVNNFSANPHKLELLEQRMQKLHHIARKYKVDVKNLYSYTVEVADKLAATENILANYGKLNAEYTQMLSDYNIAALLLREKRKSAALQLAKSITAALSSIGMPHCVLQIEFTELEQIAAHGLDKIEYKVRTNLGAKFESLAKIASGGELSRISMCIHMLTAEHGQTPTLIFDEVDVGIGGVTAALVGKMLGALAQRLQLFCVTHQAQVAVNADSHFLVSKFVTQDTTESTVVLLDANGRINEIARMLGGMTITEQTLTHARELLELAHEISNS